MDRMRVAETDINAEHEKDLRQATICRSDGERKMLKGIRSAIKYFTIGLLAGVLMAPRKGNETRKLLVERGKEYAQEMMHSGQQAS